MTAKVVKTDAQWRTQLSAPQFEVTRKKDTEPAFSGKYNECKDAGTYDCICCGAPLFSSSHKFDSGSGWPSFWQPVSPEAVKTEEDNAWSEHRTEAVCANCDAHLGHVFDDGPKPTGLRYCVNSLSLQLEKKVNPFKKLAD
jgi:peptide-methionine (R)-S-oxide reductase